MVLEQVKMEVWLSCGQVKLASLVWLVITGIANQKQFQNLKPRDVQY